MIFKNEIHIKSKQIHTQLEEILQICNDYIGTQNPCKI